MNTAATLHFHCPECGAPSQAYVNVGAVRKIGENDTCCPSCRTAITISIDIYSKEAEI